MEGIVLSDVSSWERLLLLFYSKLEACLKLLLALQQLFPESTLGYCCLLLLLCQSNYLGFLILRIWGSVMVPFLYFREVL